MCGFRQLQHLPHLTPLLFFLPLSLPPFHPHTLPLSPFLLLMFLCTHYRHAYVSVPPWCVEQSLQICFKLYSSKDSNVHNAASVAIRQVVQALFDRLNLIAEKGEPTNSRVLPVRQWVYALLTEYSASKWVVCLKENGKCTSPSSHFFSPLCFVTVVSKELVHGHMAWILW